MEARITCLVSLCVSIYNHKFSPVQAHPTSYHLPRIHAIPKLPPQVEHHSNFNLSQTKHN